MTLGLENKKKTGFLAGLLLLCGYLLYTNVFSGPSSPTPRSTPAATSDGLSLPKGTEAAAPRASIVRMRPGEFHPVLRPRRAEDRVDPMKIDPTLKLDKLAKLQAVTPDTTGRNLFQFGAPPPPPKSELAAKLPPHEEPKIELQKQAPVNLPPVQAPLPPPPFKYYGLKTITANGKRTAFFLEGDNIMIAAEGDIVEKRYRVVRIAPNSVVLEDVQLKREQSLQLAEDANVPG